MSLIDVGLVLYISKCWWCWCVYFGVAGCLLSELESAGEVELFCSLNCRETADNAAAAGYQLLPAASCRGSSQLIAAAAVARRRRRKVAVFLLAGRDNLSGSSAGWGLLTTVIQDCVCAGAMPHGCGHIYYNGNYWHYNYPPANSELPNNSQLCHCCISARCST